MVPPTSTVIDSTPLVALAFDLIDNIESKCNFRPETKAKLKKVREDVEEQIKKEAEQEKKEEVGRSWECII